MFSSFALLGLALHSAFLVPQPTPEIRRGDLTFIVRDDQGARVPGITLTLIYEGDGGRLILGDRVTDQAGAAAWPNLPFGLYIVQFRGQLPSGAAIVPLAEQNLGMLDDGSGTGGGFGIRFVEPVQTELFVLGRVPLDTRAFPMFDRATSPNAPPDRVDPLLTILAPTATPPTRLLPAPWGLIGRCCMSWAACSGSSPLASWSAGFAAGRRHGRKNHDGLDSGYCPGGDLLLSQKHRAADVGAG